MLITTHILAGLVVGKYLGPEHMLPILLGSVLIDLDHIYDMVKHGWKYGIKKSFEILFMPFPEENEQRTFFHSIFGWILVSTILYLVDPVFGKYFSIGYAVHLLLDSLDTSELQLFYPQKYNVTGFIEYNSLMEYLFGIGLFIIYFFF
ncbi:MAG: metal-dependent hydrolase [Candidatus Woesearchaeota archaeon]